MRRVLCSVIFLGFFSSLFIRRGREEVAGAVSIVPDVERAAVVAGRAGQRVLGSRRHVGKMLPWDLFSVLGS